MRYRYQIAIIFFPFIRQFLFLFLCSEFSSGIFSIAAGTYGAHFWTGFFNLIQKLESKRKGAKRSRKIDYPVCTGTEDIGQDMPSEGGPTGPPRGRTCLHSTPRNYLLHTVHHVQLQTAPICSTTILQKKKKKKKKCCLYILSNNV